MSSIRNFLSEPDKNRIVDTIRKAEAETTGEIRIHLENRCRDEVINRAVLVFQKLKMDQTKFRNGVLIYIAVKDRKFSIIGDEALHQKTEQAYWDQLTAKLSEHFSGGNYTDGIIETILQIGEKLSEHFPGLDNYQKNELPDDVSFD